MKVFLLAGQSNMQGYGLIAGYPVLHDTRIFNLATGNAEIAVEPLHHWHEHPYMPDGIGLGLAMPFALEILRLFPDLRLGFIPAARGGSSLDQWLPGKENFERALWLWGRAVKNHPGLEVGGILWHQGEADSENLETAENYGERFLLAVNGFRERLNAPTAPVVVGELGRFLTDNPRFHAHATVVRQTRAAVATLEHAAFVSSEELLSNGDNTHFNTESIRVMGQRYAKAYLDLPIFKS